MNNSELKFAPDLRISYKQVPIMLILLGQAVFLMSDIPRDATLQLRITLFATLFYVAAALIWLLDRWQPLIGHWVMIVALVTIVYAGDQWLMLPGFLTLMVIPTALAGALISLPAAIVATVGQSASLLLWNSVAPDMTLAATIPPLIAIWATLGVLFAIYHPIHQVANWSWNFYQKARVLQSEAQERKLELEQVMDDLGRANEQLTRLGMLAHGLRQDAEDARRAKEEFVANVSHELRTPLNIIIGFSETILQTPEIYGDRIPSPLMADLTVIYRNAKHLSDLVDDVLDLSQIEAGQMALTKEEVTLPEIVDGAVVAVRPLFDSKNLYLRTEIPEDLSPVFCDRTRIREVLLNLLSNAVRFTESGGVEIRAWEEKNHIVIAVADTGPGIAEEDVERLFQPFQQIDTSIRRRYGGTGLGLSISKRFIELHRGKIWVESKKEVGTTFFFQLPVDRPTSPNRGFMQGIVPGWEYVERDRPSRAPRVEIKPRFVILEAGESLQRLLARYLNEVEIIATTDLEEALKILSQGPNQAFIINDMSPDIALKRLESITLPEGIPVMVCSVPGTHESADAMGVVDYLVKPISQDTLIDALNRLDVEGKTVLIVDDEPDALQLFRRMLLSSGKNFRVLRARDGREAINALQNYHPDAMLLDLVMPNTDGFQVLKAKSEDPSLKDIPVIITSAQDPTGQPIVSNTLAITCRGGLSMHRLLTCIRSISQAFPTPGLRRQAELRDSPAYE